MPHSARWGIVSCGCVAEREAKSSYKLPSITLNFLEFSATATILSSSCFPVTNRSALTNLSAPSATLVVAAFLLDHDDEVRTFLRRNKVCKECIPGFKAVKFN